MLALSISAVLTKLKAKRIKKKLKSKNRCEYAMIREAVAIPGIYDCL